MKFTKSKTSKTPVVALTANEKLVNKIKNGNVASAKSKSMSVTANPEFVSPVHDTVNTQGFVAFSKEPFMNLLTLLNTLKLDGDQFYRTENKAVTDVQNAVVQCAYIDPYFTAQCIRYSRTDGEQLRSVTQLAGAVLSKYISSKEFAKYFYSKYNKKTKIGGLVLRLDDAVQIANVYFGLTPNAKSLPNSIRKGLKMAIEAADTHELSKYKNSGLIDLCNLVHPNSLVSNASVEVNLGDYVKILTDKASATKDAKKAEEYKMKITNIQAAKVVNGMVKIKTLDALMLGVNFVAETHEVKNTEAGQIVATAKKEGKITQKEAVELLNEAIGENFKELLVNGKLGVLACVRNLNRMVEKNVDGETVKLVVNLLTNAEAIRKSMVHPMQLDIAFEMLSLNGANGTARQFMTALQKGFELAVPNMVLTGETVVVVDVSGSMCTPMYKAGERSTYKTDASQKAFLIAATIAKATNGTDIVFFDTKANFISYNANSSVFEIKNTLSNIKYGGGTDIGCAFRLLNEKKKQYNTVILLSDNEANKENPQKDYENYVKRVADAKIYAVDLAAYGTDAIKSKNVFSFFGYGFSLFDRIAKEQYDASKYFDEIKKVRFRDNSL